MDFSIQPKEIVLSLSTAMAGLDTEIYKMLDNTDKDRTTMVHGHILSPNSKTDCEMWIARRKETWRFHQQLLKSLTNPSRKDNHSKTKTWLPMKNNEIQALFKELKGFVESKRTQNEECALFLPRQMFLNGVKSFREYPKPEDSQEQSVCSDLLQDSDTTGNDHCATADDTNIQNKVERSKHPSIKQRILKFFRLK